MFERRLIPIAKEYLGQFPAVALVGPRQVGKTTLALAVAEQVSDSIYLDLETAADRAKLADPALYLEEYRDRLVVIDEVHRLPGLFDALRSLIDRGRRRGRKAGMYLLLGSASMDLLHQSSESLAGRIGYLELTPLDILEVPGDQIGRLWLRGGFPDSFLETSDPKSLRWRDNFIRTYLERDIPDLAPRMPAETARRLWTMLAHTQGTLLNLSNLARALAIDGKTVANHLDLLTSLLLVRRLPPFHGNPGKRLVKSPKVYVRDSGVLHALIGIPNRDKLFGHPVVGASWEGFVIEQLIGAAPHRTEASFYRSGAGAEIDLVLDLPGGDRWAIEIKRSTAPKLEKGFHIACEDIGPKRKLVIYAGTERYPMPNGVEAISLATLAAELQALAR